MGGSTVSSFTTTGVHSLKPVLISFSLVVIYFSHIADARAVPRSSSRSFRFPSSVDDQVPSKDRTSILFLAKDIQENNSYFTEKSQARNAFISLNNNPIKPAVPESPANPIKNEHSLEQTFSTEIVEAGLNFINQEKINDDDQSKNMHEDEVLREALCPSAENGFSSAPKASNASEILVSSVDPRKLLYDLQSGKCAEIGKRGHCGENMIFVSDNDSAAYGYCECDFENRILRTETKQAALFRKTPLVYHPTTNACYRLYEKAYCKDGEWLVLRREQKGPVCEPSQCSQQASIQQEESRKPISGARGNRSTSNRRRASKLLTPALWANVSNTIPESAKGLSSGNVPANGMEQEKHTIWVPLNGSGPCVRLFEQNSKYCENDEQVVFNVGDIVPKCGIVGRGIEGRAIIRNACPPGSYYSIIGRCQPDWDF